MRVAAAFFLPFTIVPLALPARPDKLTNREETMDEVPLFEAGGYRYIKAVFQYSSGVAAQEGYEIERARFVRPLSSSADSINVRCTPIATIDSCEIREAAPDPEQK